VQKDNLKFTHRPKQKEIAIRHNIALLSLARFSEFDGENSLLLVFDAFSKKIFLRANI